MCSIPYILLILSLPLIIVSFPWYDLAFQTLIVLCYYASGTKLMVRSTHLALLLLCCRFLAQLVTGILMQHRGWIPTVMLKIQNPGADSEWTVCEAVSISF